MSRLTAGLFVALLVAPAAFAAETSSPQTAFINEQIAAKWKEADIKRPAARATNDEFLRRVFLDLIGRIATPEEVLDFEQDRTGDKRAKLVRRLLYESNYQPRVNGLRVPAPSGKKGEYLTFDYASEYAQHWANLWTIWLMSRTGDARYREQMRIWLQSAFMNGMSHKDMVVQLLTATGKTNANGAVNFILHHLGANNPRGKRTELGQFDAVPITSRVTRLFLGIQTQCMQCHDHPFRKEWVQSDFWGVNAFFRQTASSGTLTRPGPNANQQGMGLGVVELLDDPSVNTSGIVFYERRDGKLMAARPSFLKDMAQAEKGESAAKTLSSANGAKTRREALARYIITHDNFAKAYVNRIWGHLFGRGLHKEPAVDNFGDFGGENPVVHPELLARLAKDFARYEYNPKLLMEWICNSVPYQLSHVASKAYADSKYDPYFARMPLKALSPEVLFESLMTATRAEYGTSTRRHKEMRERWLGKLVRNFGDDEGNEITFNGTIIQALLMMNGKELNEEIGPKGANTVARVVREHTRGGVVSFDGTIDELFLMTLNRHPTSVEKGKLRRIQQRGAILKGETPKKPQPYRKPPVGKRGKNRKPTDPPGVVLPTTVNDLTFYQDVFWALLNTNEFMLNH